MSIKLLVLIALVIIFALLIVYNRLTNISFADNRAHVSAAYCKLSGSPTIERPVIFIPGTKGSTLQDSSGNVWLNLRQIFPGDTPLLYDSANDHVAASGILTRVSLIPKLAEYRSYFGISVALACSPKAYFYYYDWRKNPADNVPGLGQLVERVRQETGEKPSIIAHSMGGLITHYYMKEHADEIDKVAYVGVPFGSGLSFLEDIDNGSPVGLNRTLLSAQALFSHPGSFALLPHQGTKLYKGLDLMEVGTWKENELSAYKNGFSDDHLLEQNLQKAKDFFAVLDQPKPMANEFLFIVGNCQDTLAEIGIDNSKIFKPGDGRVLAEAALPIEQEQLNKKVITFCTRHDQQLNDKEIIKRVLQFLQ
jgi:pimeloyl-ACP methyl ester carboxylesterase